MRVASILSSIFLIIWVILTIGVIWFDVLNTVVYFKISISFAIVIIAIILVALAIKEYVNEKKLEEHNYLD
jgi:membrane protein CcdC involved in cytochrome C biogenesis